MSLWRRFVTAALAVWLGALGIVAGGLAGGMATGLAVRAFRWSAGLFGYMGAILSLSLLGGCSVALEDGGRITAAFDAAGCALVLTLAAAVYTLALIARGPR